MQKTQLIFFIAIQIHNSYQSLSEAMQVIAINTLCFVHKPELYCPLYLYYSILISQCFLSGHCHFYHSHFYCYVCCYIVEMCLLSLYQFILLPFFLYDLMKKKIICLPTYPNFSDRVGSGETKIFLNVAQADELQHR